MEAWAPRSPRTPNTVKYLPVDFASQNIEIELASVGVRAERPTFFAWLGVTQYISEEAGLKTLSLVARHGVGSEVVFDVIRPLDGLPPDEYAISAAARDLSAERGEPWISYFVPEELGSRLTSLGFTMVTHLTPEAAAAYYRDQAPDVTPLSAWELIAARI
jgi:methyltransferase (TIGR00027 family)